MIAHLHSRDKVTEHCATAQLHYTPPQIRMQGGKRKSTLVASKTRDIRARFHSGDLVVGALSPYPTSTGRSPRVCVQGKTPAAWVQNEASRADLQIPDERKQDEGPIGINNRRRVASPQPSGARADDTVHLRHLENHVPY